MKGVWGFLASGLFSSVVFDAGVCKMIVDMIQRNGMCYPRRKIDFENHDYRALKARSISQAIELVCNSSEIYLRFSSLISGAMELLRTPLPRLRRHDTSLAIGYDHVGPLAPYPMGNATRAGLGKIGVDAPIVKRGHHVEQHYLVDMERLVNPSRRILKQARGRTLRLLTCTAFLSRICNKCARPGTRQILQHAYQAGRDSRRPDR